jgi:hypothetical protein
MEAVCSSKIMVTACITSDKHDLDFQYCENLKYPLQLNNFGCNKKIRDFVIHTGYQLLFTHLDRQAHYRLDIELRSEIQGIYAVIFQRGMRFGGFKPPPKFQSFDKAKPNSQFRGKYIHNNLIRIQISLTCKLSGNPG